MQHLFIPKKLELIAIKKGFKEPCLKQNTTFHYPNTNFIFSDGGILYQQIIDWLKKNHKIIIEPFTSFLSSSKFSTQYRVQKFGKEYRDLSLKTLDKSIEAALKLI